jgi:hypothetical protein
MSEDDESECGRAAASASPSCASAARVSVPDDVVDRLRAWAATKPQIRRLGLFGSRVRDDRSCSCFELAPIQ